MQFQASNRMSNVGEKFLSIQQEKIKQLKSKNINTINLGRGTPDQPTFRDIIFKAELELNNKINYGYPPYGGNSSLKNAVKKFYKKEYRVELAEDEITIFSGSTAALTAIPMTLVNMNDYVLVPDPSFSGYHIGITMSGAKEWHMPLTEENGYLPDLEKIPQEIINKSKLMFLNYPNNPTGADATHEFFNKVVSFGEKNKIAIVHDFAYGDIYFKGKAPSFLQSQSAKKVGIEIYTFSKTFNMAGWRCAFAVGNASIIKLLKQYIQNSVGGTFGVVQNAGSFALLTQAKQRNNLRNLYKKRKNIVINELRKYGFSVKNVSGSFFVWMKLPDYISNDKLFADKLLNIEHVAVVPGSVFGKYGEGFIRISLVAKKNVLQEGVRKISSFLKVYH